MGTNGSPKKVFFDDVYNEKYSTIEEFHRMEADQNERIRNYLKEIGTALLEGAKERELPREVAFKFYIDVFGLDKQDTYLYKSWEILELTEFRKIRNYNLRLSKLNEKLQQERKVSTRITLDRVMDFFRSDTGKPYLNKYYDWASTRNAFLAWRFNMDQGTVKDYLHRANKKSSLDHEVDSSFIFPDFHKRYSFSAFTNSTSFHTVVANHDDIEEEV